MPLLPKVQCPNFLDFWNPWWKVMERSGLRFETFAHKGCKIAAAKIVFTDFFLLLYLFILFIFLFVPTSQSPISKLFRFSESLGKSNGKKWSKIWKLLLINGTPIAAQKMFCLVLFFLANFALLAGFFWYPILDTRISVRPLSSSSVTLRVPPWNLKRLDWRALMESRPPNIEQKTKMIAFFLTKKNYFKIFSFFEKKVICSDFSRFYQIFLSQDWAELEWSGLIVYS